MRILISTFSRDIAGGVETYLRALLPRLIDRGHEVSLLHELPPAAGGLRIDEGAALSRIISVHELGRDGALAEVQRQPPDVVYQHGVLDPELERALLDRSPAILYAHSYYGACVSGTKRFAFPRRRMCGRPLGPLCLLHYPLHRCGGRSPRRMLREYRLQRSRQRMLRRYAAVLVASRHMAAEMERSAGVVSRLAPYFPPATRPDPSPPAPRPRSFRVLFAGRLTAEKGVRFLWPAAAAAGARLRQALTLVFAGSGPDEAWLRAAPPSPWIRPELVGWADRAALEAQLRQADLLAVPSLWPEPFGIIGVEAACLGVPSVAYETGGITDWLLPGKAGEVAPGEVPTVRGLADALVRALGEEAHWQSLRVGAWEASGRFTPEAHLATLDAALDAAVTHAGARR